MTDRDPPRLRTMARDAPGRDPEDRARRLLATALGAARDDLPGDARLDRIRIGLGPLLPGPGGAGPGGAGPGGAGPGGDVGGDSFGGSAGSAGHGPQSGPPVAGTTATATSIGAATTAASSASLGLAKGAIVALGVLTAVGVGVAVLPTSGPGPSAVAPPSQPEAAHVTDMTEPRPADPPATPELPAVPAPSDDSIGASQPPAGIGAHERASRPRPSPRVAGPGAIAPGSVEPGSAADDPAAEAALLTAAQAALASNPAEALALTQNHVRRFPSGMLIQEREVIRIDALARLGRDPEARAAAQRFIQRFPGSSHAQRVRELTEM